MGWLADEGCGPLAWRIFATDLAVPIPVAAVLRHARPDVETKIRGGAVDYGFLIFLRAPPGSPLRQRLTLEVLATGARLAVDVTPEVLSDRRLLDMLLLRAGGADAHGGADMGRHAFMAGVAGETAVSLFQAHVAGHAAGRSVHRFRPRQVARSFVTVLFGSAEPVKVQPVLFRHAGIEVGEWIYVCNSPEDGETVLRLSRMMADLYDAFITVIVMPDNVGFGAANNAAVVAAASDAIVLVNPDVYPLPTHAGMLRAGLDGAAPAGALRGGLLLYDDHTLMHSGMRIDFDTVVRQATLNAAPGSGDPPALDLLRVEHFDKGVPFAPSRWTRPLRVPAITGAVMAFRRAPFERLGGFSTRYIYGHYEDADLSLRWAGADGETPATGPVMVDPRLRLVHLEGQGSKPRGDYFRAAAILNRHLFTLRHGAAFARDPAPFTDARDLAPGAA